MSHKNCLQLIQNDQEIMFSSFNFQFYHPSHQCFPAISFCLHRLKYFVQRYQCKDPIDCKMESLPQVLSQESKELITSTLGKGKKSVWELIVCGMKKSYSTVQRYLYSIGAKSFHQTSGLKLTEKNVKDTLSFTELLEKWNVDHFLFLAPSDEFYVFEERCPNK